MKAGLHGRKTCYSDRIFYIRHDTYSNCSKLRTTFITNKLSTQMILRTSVETQNALPPDV